MSAAPPGGLASSRSACWFQTCVGPSRRSSLPHLSCGGRRLFAFLNGCLEKANLAQGSARTTAALDLRVSFCGRLVCSLTHGYAEMAGGGHSSGRATRSFLPMWPRLIAERRLPVWGRQWEVPGASLHPKLTPPNPRPTWSRSTNDEDYPCYSGAVAGVAGLAAAALASFSLAAARAAVRARASSRALVSC